MDDDLEPPKRERATSKSGRSSKRSAAPRRSKYLELEPSEAEPSNRASAAMLQTRLLLAASAIAATFALLLLFIPTHGHAPREPFKSSVEPFASSVRSSASSLPSLPAPTSSPPAPAPQTPRAAPSSPLPPPPPPIPQLRVSPSPFPPPPSPTAPPPSPSPALPPLPATPWEHHPHTNCWWGGHGAQEVDSPPGSAVTSATSLSACQAACATTPSYGCEAILFAQSDGRCYRKRHVDVSKCSPDSELDLYLRTDARPSSLAIPLIVDTDMSFDVDDALALCMAHALHDLGEADLLAVMHNTGYPEGIAGASVLSHYYHHDDEVKLGAYKGPFGRDKESAGRREWRSGPYVPSLVRGWPAPVESSADVPDAVSLYRTLLAAADDDSVAIAAIGFATNLAALLKSPPDSTSPLNGTALVARKVRIVTWQGGWYASRHPAADLAKRKPEDEFNWGCGRRWFAPIAGCEGTAAYAVGHMPTSVEQIFSEVGFLMPTGDTLMQCAESRHPCRAALATTKRAWHQDPSGGRASWDAMVTLMAVRGPEGVRGSKGGVGGTNVVDQGGTNHWRVGSNPAASKHSYLVLDGDRADWPESVFAAQAPVTPALTEMRDEINRLLCRPPKGAE